MQVAIGLDVGEKRIGVAFCDGQVRIAVPYGVVAMNDQAVIEIEKLIDRFRATVLVVGLPRNNQGKETKQSQYVRDFVEKLRPLGLPIVLQDESLTSVEAEQRLQGLPLQEKGKIDAEAAAIILSDYLEANFG
jgi:putative Holliday junction resolvase